METYPQPLKTLNPKAPTYHGDRQDRVVVGLEAGLGHTVSEQAAKGGVPREVGTQHLGEGEGGRGGE